MLNELLLECTNNIGRRGFKCNVFYIENRSPFFNHKLFEYLNTVDTKYFIKNGYAKFTRTH